MYYLMTKHYAAMHKDLFLKDLSEKEGVILLSTVEGELQGFSTYMFLHTSYRGDEVVALFSGDTIIDREFWGTPALFKVFGRLLYHFMEDHKGKKAYWFLTTKGFRTYLMLPLFFKRYYPRVDTETPPYEKGLIEHLAVLKYGSRYDRDRGVIDTGSYYLKGSFAEIPARKMRDKNVRFFVEKNPGYVRGDELACVCEISHGSFRRRTAMLVRP